MDAFASPSIHGESGRYRAVRLVEGLLVAFVLALSLVSIPGPPDTRLDASWQEMLIHAHAQGMQFGRDLIFTWGPWGFLCSRYHLGGLEAVPILVWQTAGQLLIAVALVILTRSLPGWRRIAFAVSFLAFHWLFLDVVYFVLIALIALVGLMRREASVAQLIGWALVLGCLSQLKFTYFMLSAAAVLAAAACWWARTSRTRGAAILGAYGGAVVAAWLAAGQNPDNLYPYVRRSLEIASGYGDAMVFDETWTLFLWGAAVALLCGVFAWDVGRAAPDRCFARSAAGFLAFSFFVMWKESFTRADMVPLGGHVFGLFTYVLILGPVLPGLLFPGRRWQWFDALFPACLVGIASFDAAYYREGPRVARERIQGNLQSLGRLGSLPAAWEDAYQGACRAAARPALKAAIGRGTVDVYDFNTGAALLNGLSLASRPIFQGYSAYTPGLAGWNLRFYQSDHAPEFLLWNDERVDNRYPGEDDAPLVAALAGAYAPVFVDRDYWLFKRTAPVGKAPPVHTLLMSRSVRLGEEIVLPPTRDRALWLQADAVPNMLGRLRAQAYKPAVLNMATTDDQGHASVWRLLPRVARAGFILVPTLASGSDLAAMMRGEATSWVRSFHFEAPAGQEEFWSHVDVGVFGVPGLPLRPALPVPWLVALGILDRPALWVTSVSQQQVVDVPEGRALLLHAQGEIAFAVPPGATRLVFGFGLREGAYTGDGHTAGVNFDVEATGSSGQRELLWSRFLDPAARAGDRGTQTGSVPLTGAPPSIVVLHTTPGLAHDNRWDWSYVSALHFAFPAEK